MRVELLVVPDCPNEVAAHEVVAQAAALAEVVDLDVTITVIDSDEEAQRRGFAGSPTFLIEGIDPFAVPGAPTGVACPVYPTAGGLSGTPDVFALREALLRACAAPATSADDR
jgi:hypothetical protein